MDRNTVVVLATLAGLAGCVTRPQRQVGIPVAGTTVDVEAIIRAALLLDAAADRNADTLYAAEATVLANARQRFATPRVAGVSYGGRIAVGSSNVTVEGRWAWAVVDYRWIGSQPNQVESGRATVVCVRRERGWKILHLHSSQQLPWDR